MSNRFGNRYAKRKAGQSVSQAKKPRMHYIYRRKGQGKFASGTSSSRRTDYTKGRLAYFGPSYMPAHYTTNLRFSATYSITTAGGVQDTLFRGNGLQDPFQAAGGTEPAGWDELATIYGYYRVHASGIKLHIVNNDTDDPIQVALWASVNSASPSSFSAPSQAGAKTIQVANQSGSGVIQHYARSKDILGPYSATSSGWAATNTVPSAEWFWHFHVYNVSAQALNLVYIVEMVYWVEFGYLATQNDT